MVNDEKFFNQILKKDGYKKICLCSFCKKNESTTMYYRYIYVICLKNPKDDKVSSHNGFICDECIAEYKKDGYLTEHVDDIDYGCIVAYENKKSDIVFSPFTNYTKSPNNFTNQRLFFGINYVAPFGNGVDEKNKPECHFSHNTNSISINFTACKTRDFLRDAKIIFFL